MIRINGKEYGWEKGMTVTDLIKKVNDSYHYAVVRINNRHVSRPYFDKTYVEDHSEVYLISMIAGG